MIVPVYSAGVMIVSFSIGSSMWSMYCGSGMAEGLSTARLLAVGEVGDVLDRRGRGYEREAELALEPLADDLHVQQAEEPAAEAEAEGGARLGLVGHAGVVQLELLEGVAQVRELVAVDRVKAAEDHRLRVLVALERLRGRAASLGDRLADTCLADVFDARR